MQSPAGQRDGARLPTETMTAFIADHRDAFGVEPICRVLPIAPSTYHAHAMVKRSPELASDRARRDAALLPEIKRVWDDNLKVYGVRKVWHQLRREGFDVARCPLSCMLCMHCRAVSGPLDETAWTSRGYPG
jgi:helix-turn-helix protein